MLGASANKTRGGNVKRLARGAGGRRASSAPRLRKTVQLDTVAEPPCASDVPQRHEIAIQTDGQMGRLALDLNVHHHLSLCRATTATAALPRAWGPPWWLWQTEHPLYSTPPLTRFIVIC